MYRCRPERFNLSIILKYHQFVLKTNLKFELKIHQFIYLS